MSPQTPTAEGTEPSLKSIFAKKEFSECLLSNTEEEVARLHFQVAHHSPTGAQAAPPSVRPSIRQCGHKLILQAIVVITLKQSATG